MFSVFLCYLAAQHGMSLSTSVSSEPPGVPPSIAEGSQTACSTSSVGDTVPKAPIVPFGLDLYYWGQKQPNAGKIIK